MTLRKIVIEYESEDPVFSHEHVKIEPMKNDFDGVHWLRELLNECKYMHVLRRLPVKDETRIKAF